MTERFKQTDRATVRRSPSEGFSSSRGAVDVSDTVDTAQAPPASWDDDDIDEVQDIDEPLPEKPTKVPEISVQERILLLQPLQARSITVKKLLTQPRMLCWLPQGKSLACVFYEKVSLFNVKEGRVVDLAFSGLADAICCSPDGRIIVTSSEGRIQFWNTTGLEEDSQLQSFLAHAQHIYGLDWSNEKLAIWDGTVIRVFIFPKGEISQSFLTKEQGLTCNRPGLLKWSSDGSWLAAGASNGMLICWQVDTKRQRVLSSDLHWRPYSLVWFPGSLILAAAFVHKRSDNKRIIMWNMREEHPIASWEKLSVLPFTLSASIQQRLVIASAEKQLLFGSPNDDSPTAWCPGQLFALWSPTEGQLATLDPQDPTTLVLLSNLSASNTN